MEEFELRKNIIFNSFNDVFKGNPLEINYKLLKKVLPDKEENKIKELNLNEENLRNCFEKFIKKIKSKHCLIYKK